MKKYTLIILFFGLFFFNAFVKSEMVAQGSVVVTFDYNGYTTQCCSASTVNYFCFNSPNNTGYCGQTTTCNTQTFADPVPAGNIVTNISVNFYSAGCAGGTMTGTLNGAVIGSVAESNNGCLCTNTIWAVTGNTTGNYPCGITNSGYPYVYGGSNSFQFCASGGQICMDKATLTITYAPANQANPASQPGAISGTTPVCPGVPHTYSIAAVANATSYTWTVPAGWSINSGQGTTSISATAGSAGNICVTATNACGTSAPTCFAVTIASSSSAPASASASPNPICPGNSTTLNVSGGSLGSGANWNWYTGSCGGTLVGTGSSISVSPGSTTTYYVAAVGTCNTTACASTVVTVGGTQATPGAPSGSTSICSGSTQVYTTTGSAGATSYNWTVPSGAVINSGQGTTSISVTFGASSGNVCVTGTGACGTSAAACTAVTITTVPSTPGSITGTTPVCPGSYNYSIGAVGGATGYTWSVTGAGGSITAGQGTTGITVSWPSSGTGTVSVTANNACGSSPVATFTVLVNPLPTLTAVSTPTAVCAGGTATLTVSGASTYTWTGGTSPTTGGTVTATPAGNTTYNVTGTDANNCVNSTSVNLTINPTPTVTIAGSPSQAVCSGGTVSGITFNVNPAGTISWANTNTGLGGPLSSASGSGNIGSYTAPIVGSVTTGVVTANAVANGTGCPSNGTSASFTLTINPPPVVGTASVTAAPCGQNSGCINSVSVSGGAPTYSYSWNGGTSWSVSSGTCNIPAGNYPLEVQDQNGCIGTGTITVSSTNGPTAPQVNASTNNACVGDNVPLNITGANGTYTYTWSDASGTTTGTTYTVTNIGPAGNYTINVTATDPNSCVSTATTITVTVNAAPSGPILSSANNPLIECQGSTPAAITVATTGTVTSVPVWYNGSTWVNTGTSYTPSTAIPGTTIYTIKDSATVAGCVNSTAGNVLTVTVTINATPTAPTVTSANNPLTECQNSTPGTITVATTGTVTSIPVWYNGSTWVNTGTSYSPSTATPGTIVYTVSDSSTVNGCLSSSAGNVLTVTVTINAIPGGPTLSSANNPLTECQGSTPGTITVATTGTVTSVPVWYNGSMWVNTGTSYSPSTAIPGVTVYTISDSSTVNGCVNTTAGNILTVTVTINATPTAPTVTSANNPLTECQNSTPGTITVATTGTVTSVPVWYNGSTHVSTGTSYSPSTATAGTTIYTVSDSSTVNGCLSSTAGNVLTVTVTIVAPPTAPIFSGSVNNPLFECQGQPPISVGVATTGTVTSVPVWYNGSTWVNTGTSYSPGTANVGTVVYTIIDSATVSGCKDISAGNVLTLTVTVNASPTVTGTPTVTGSCTQPTGNVSNVTVNGGTPMYHYQWYNGSTIMTGDTLPSLSNVGPGTYSVLVTDANNCPAIGGTTTFTIANVAIVAGFSPSTIEGPAPLNVSFTNTSTGATVYGWNFGSGTTTSSNPNPNYTYNTLGTYTVLLVATNGTCIDSAYATILVDVPTTIIIPNVFSPNGDSLNDEFFIVCTGMKTLTCDIYNRWGQSVFTLKGPNQSWDGRLNNGIPAAEGTYFYMLNAVGIDGKNYTQQGSLTLVK